MSIKITVEGADRVVANLEKFDESMKSEFDRTILREVIRIRDYAVEYAPVDTSALRTSIRFAKISRWKYTVGDGVHYGIYQEFGTSRMPAHPFLVPAVYSSLPEYEAELQTILSRIPKV
jgi:HK97 gp10 family phage protein